MTISIPTKARAPTTKVFYAEPTEQSHQIKLLHNFKAGEFNISHQSGADYINYKLPLKPLVQQHMAVGNWTQTSASSALAAIALLSSSVLRLRSQSITLSAIGCMMGADMPSLCTFPPQS
jgi:hypothetical protein